MGEKSLRENVILLAMSTLPISPEPSIYYYGDGKHEYVFNSISQLESGTKFFIKSLAEHGKKVNRIVILCTEKVFEEKNDNGWDIVRKNEELESVPFNAVTYFQKRIGVFLLKKDEQEGTVAAKYIDGNKVDEAVVKEGKERAIISEEVSSLYLTEISDKVSYDEKEIEKMFIVQNLFGASEKTYPWETVQKIKGKNPQSKINLYLDMQGGDRNTIAQINAITELLRDQNVKIDSRVATKFENRKHIHQMSEVSDQYQVYDLLSAMQIFKKYGRGNELVEYVENRLNESNNNDRNKKLVDTIKKASDSIQLCEVGGFDDAVNEIANQKADFANTENPDQIDIIFEDIYRDYETIFHGKYKYVEQIKWCLNKNFIQQALTILEARMPYEYVTSGLMCYCRTGADSHQKVNLIQSFENIYTSLDDKDHYRMKDIDHFFICDQVRCGSAIPRLYGLDSNDLKEQIDRNIAKYKCIRSLRNKTNHVEQTMHDPYGFYEYMRANYPSDNNWNQSPNNINTKKIIRRFLRDFIKLADKVSDDKKGISLA